MKCIYAVSLLLTLFTSVLSQPVITREDVLFPGNDYRVSNATVIPPQGPSGPNVTWNFASLQQGLSATIQVEEADDTPYSGNFPGANIALVDATPGASFYLYVNLTDDIWEELGSISPDGSAAIEVTYEDPRTYLQFPVAYNEQWSDDYTYTIHYETDPPITTLGEGSISARVDGYGTLILPQATFNDVLRVRLIGSSTDTTELGMGLYERNYFNDTTYIWMSPSYYGALATHFSGLATRITTVIIAGDTMQFPESIAYESFTYDPQAEPTSGVSDIIPGLHALQISPNPFMEFLEVSFDSKETETVSFRLSDLQGKVVFEKTIQATAGKNILPIQIQNIIPGSYIASLQTPAGIDVQPVIHIERR